MKFSIYALLFFVFIIAGCDTPEPNDGNGTAEASADQLPYLTFQKENVFPGDGSLLRAEDGVSLEDGRIIVVDEAKGLRLIEKDGSNRPFGNFAAAGFVHLPPDQVSAPNGMVLGHDGEHLLMSDLGDGKIYRINIATEEVEMIYDHPYGVNTVYQDKTGAIWFSQSTENTNIGELFRDVNLPAPLGALYRMADSESVPTKIADSLYMANGIVMDKDEKYLYLAETMMDRVHSFEVDVASGTANYMGVAANVESPDNLSMDKKGRLIVGSPLYNLVTAVDFKNHSQHVIFDGSTKDNLKSTNEWHRRSHLGMERLELLSPDLFLPLPGLVTGMFFSDDGKTVYITNLGNDLLKYELAIALD